MMIAVYIVAGIIALIIILALVAPKKYDISRSIEINRPIGEVFDYLKYVKNQDNWSPWKKKDPDMKQTFTGEDGQVGFISHWEGNKHVGIGEQEIKSIDHNKALETELRFYKPWKSVSQAYIRTEDNGSGGTKVIWGFNGAHKVPANIMMMFMSMEKVVGKDFDEGLADLKGILEGN